MTNVGNGGEKPAGITEGEREKDKMGKAMDGDENEWRELSRTQAENERMPFTVL